MASSDQTIIFFLKIALFSIISNISNLSLNTVEGASGTFNYSDPGKWGSQCMIGKKQSPIDIVTKEAIPDHKLGLLRKTQLHENAVLINNGRVIEVEVEGNTTVTIQGKTYNLLQFHWHTPSEHHINGIQYAAELHQVYKNASDGQVAVIAILYKYGEPNPLVSKIQPYLRQLVSYKELCHGHETEEEEQQRIPIGKLKAKLIKHGLGHYYRYFGSITSPPCDEIVTWTVLSKVKTMSEEQVRALREPLCPENKNNSRPLQSLHGRKVQHYDVLL